MAQKPSTYFPPPTDYAPRPRANKPTHFNEKRGHSNRHRGSHGYRSTSFHKDHQAEDNTEPVVKLQPKDKFHRCDDDDYFARVQDDEEERDKRETEEHDNDETIEMNRSQDEDEDDPLDAYMKSLESGEAVQGDEPHPEDEKIATEDKLDVGPHEPNERAKAVRLDIDATEDIEESYYKYVEEKINQPDEDDWQDLVEYDKEGNVICVKKVKKEVEPLQPIDHSKISYQKFERDFYKEHEDISKLSFEESENLRKKLEIRVSGRSPPKPVCSFAHFNFDEKLMKVIRKSEYYQPTPIQAQAIPTAMSGRNLIGIAMTGSGKTAAYLWPLIVHIKHQSDLSRGDGPIGLILVPTRELAQQVYIEAKKFSSSYKLRVVCAYGGGSKYEQSCDLEAGAEIVVGTPGRVIDLVKSESTNLKRVTYLVLDEADRFFDMGFEAQVRSICDQIRPDRQTLLFSATFKSKVEQLALSVTEDPIRIVQKSLGEANEDITQHVLVFHEDSAKLEWLMRRLVEFTASGTVLIFVTRIVNCEELHKRLSELDREMLMLHGDMKQIDRNHVITSFKRKECDIMIATDVAARGLDISHIRTVINYDVAREIDTHIHRIGRTGRAGMKGDAYTLLNAQKDKEFAGHLVRNLESSNQKISKELLKLAMQSFNFRKSRQPQRTDYHEKQHNSSQASSSSHHYDHHKDQSQSHGSHKQRSDNRFEHRTPSDKQYHHNRHSHHHNNHRSTHSHHSSRYRDDRDHSNSNDRKRSKWH